MLDDLSLMKEVHYIGNVLYVFSRSSCWRLSAPCRLAYSSSFWSCFHGYFWQTIHFWWLPRVTDGTCREKIQDGIAYKRGVVREQLTRALQPVPIVTGLILIGSAPTLRAVPRKVSATFTVMIRYDKHESATVLNGTSFMTLVWKRFVHLGALMSGISYVRGQILPDAALPSRLFSPTCPFHIHIVVWHPPKSHLRSPLQVEVVSQNFQPDFATLNTSHRRSSLTSSGQPFLEVLSNFAFINFFLFEVSFCIFYLQIAISLCHVCLWTQPTPAVRFDLPIASPG